MKKISIALALILAGGAALSTANAASLTPAVATVAEIARGGDARLQLVGGYGYKKRYWGDAYYKGFCYHKPYHGWCKKNRYKKDFYKNDFDNKNDPFKVR